MRRGKRLPGLTLAAGFTLHPFDKAHGVRTSGLIPGRHLKSGHRHDRHSTAYFGAAPSVFKAVLGAWRKSKPAARTEEFTFVDLGAGMGRAVLLASTLQFRAVVGVELNPTLARMARRNVALWKRRGNARSAVTICCRDVMDYQLPAGPCLVFLFNPFGATVMKRLLKQIAAHVARRRCPVDLIYVNDEQAAILRAHPDVERLFRGRIRRSRSDAIADRAVMANQPEVEYAADDYEHCSIWRWIDRGDKPRRSG